MKTNKTKNTTKLALFAGATALAALAPQTHAQSSDALIDKLVDKGILTTDEAKDLREETDKDFNTAFQAKTGMPDYVTGYKIYGSVRGRFEQFSGNNTTAVDKTRERYRLFFGITVSLQDNLEAGFRIGSGDLKGTAGQGNPLSQNSTMGNNWSDKGLYVDLAYGKWTPINSGDWTLSTTVGKMERDVVFGNSTWMIIDPDLTPEGGVIQTSYAINNNQSISLTGAGLVLASGLSGTTHQPTVGGGQLLWNAKWTDKWSSMLAASAFAIASPQQLSNANETQINQGNSRYASGPHSGSLLYNYTPIIGDASVTYLMDTFPFYAGACPIMLKGEAMNNPGAPKNNDGYWVGVTLGKAGPKHTWDLTYRYEYLESDAWYDQLEDDDNVAYYRSAPGGGGSSAFVGGTNIKGHFIKLNYSVTDSVMFSASCYLNSLINPTVNGTKEPQSSAMHFFADIMWKF
jgi:hypothetical protein